MNINNISEHAPSMRGVLIEIQSWIKILQSLGWTQNCDYSFIITKKIKRNKIPISTHGATEIFFNNRLCMISQTLIMVPPPAHIKAYPVFLIFITCLCTNLTNIWKINKHHIITCLLHLFLSILKQQPKKGTYFLTFIHLLQIES